VMDETTPVEEWARRRALCTLATSIDASAILWPKFQDERAQ
jgi:hypothetical protein